MIIHLKIVLKNKKIVIPLNWNYNEKKIIQIQNQVLARRRQVHLHQVLPKAAKILQEKTRQMKTSQ